MPDDSAELALSDQEPGANPSFDLITRPPTLHVPAYSFDDRESGLNHVGATERPAELIGDAQPVDGERFLQALFQAARGARIQVHQLAMQTVQRTLGVGVVRHRVGVLEFPFDVGFVFVRQVIHDTAFLVDLAALDESRLASVAAYGRMQSLPTIQDIQPRCGEVQSALHQFTQQGTHHCRVLRRAFADTEYRFASIAANPKGYNHLPVLERGAVDEHGAQPQLAQRALHQLLHGPLLIDLVSFLHSDSLLFLAEKTTRRRSRLQV